MILSFVTLVVIVKNFAPVGDVEIQGFFFLFSCNFLSKQEKPWWAKEENDF